MKIKTVHVLRTILILPFISLFMAAESEVVLADDGASREHTTNGLSSGLPASLDQVGQVAWDSQATTGLTEALHELHDTWNAGDIEGLKKHVIGDDVLVTFELDPTTHQTIVLNSKTEIDDFISSINTAQIDKNIITKLDHPTLRCRATTSWGVCTEQCTVNLFDRQTGESVGTELLVSTQVAVKVQDEWRWIQWHISQGPTTQQLP